MKLLQKNLTASDPDKSKRLFVFLWLGCIVGVLCLFPYIHFLGLLPPLNTKTFLVAIIQPVILFGIVCFISYFLVRKVDLHPFSTQKPLKRIVIPGIVTAILIAAIFFILEKTVFHSSVLNQAIHPPAWSGFLASFYGGFNEEVLCRLFLLTLIYFLLCKIFRNVNHRTELVLTAILIAALIFAGSHLPALFRLVPSPSAFEISRILLLNGIPGIFFGWLYCTKGFWAAAIAHFITDLLIHVF